MKNTLSLLCALLCCFVLFGQTTIELSDELLNASIAKQGVIFEDADHSLAAREIFQNSSIEFSEIDREVKNLQFTTSTWWVKYRIKNKSSQEHFLIEIGRPITNSIKLYQDGNVHPVQALGDDHPFDNRSIETQDCTFDLHIPRGETTEIVFELLSDGEMIFLPTVIWSKDGYLSHHSHNQLLRGLYYGMLMIVILIYLFFYILLRKNSFLFYVSYVGSLLLLQFSLDGYSFQYLFPNSPYWANHMVLITAGTTVVSLLLYIRSFLQTDQFSPILTKVFKVFMWLVIAITFGSIVSDAFYTISFPLINGTSLLGIVFALSAIFIARRHKRKVDPYFQIAFVIVTIGAISFMLSNFGLIDSQYLGEVSLKLSSSIEVLFLSFSMASLYKQLQAEKEAAQAEAMKTLEEKNELTEKINERLENEVAERTKEVLEQKHEIEEQHKEIKDSIQYAKRIQSAILPPEKTVKSLLPNAFIFYLPKDIVAGDFYWLEQQEDKTFIAAADCTGHGVPGAMVSVVCNNALNRSVREFGLSTPASILEKTREIVIEEFSKSEEDVKDGMDVALCSIKGDKLEYSGANNPLWVIREGDVIEIKANKQPVARYDFAKPFENHEFKLQEKDAIYLFSDGYVDQFGGDRGKKLKSRKFKELLLSIQGYDMEVQKLKLAEFFDKWRSGMEQIDDVCVIGIKF